VAIGAVSDEVADWGEGIPTCTQMGGQFRKVRFWDKKMGRVFLSSHIFTAI
jgi:hypothetical protein